MRRYLSFNRNNLAYTSTIFNLGLIENINKTSIEDRKELSKIYPNVFADFFFLMFKIRGRFDLISNGFLDIIKEKNIYPNIRVFLFWDNPLNLKHTDFIKFNKLLELNVDVSRLEILFDNHKFITSFVVSSAFCFSEQTYYHDIRENVIDDVFKSIDLINSCWKDKISLNSSIYAVYHITFDSDKVIAL